MVISNEKLALLYNETEDKKNKQKIFLELKDNLKEKTSKIINFWVKNFSDNYEKYDDFQTYRQIADLTLVDTLNIFMGTNENFNLEKWYIERLKNNIYDANLYKIKKDNYEISMDFQLENMDNIISDKNYSEIELSVDNKYLYDIIKSYIDKINFISKGQKKKSYYKNMFLDSIGFNKEKISKSYAEIAEQNNCTRQNVRDCCTRYMDSLKKLLEKDNRLEELGQYL